MWAGEDGRNIRSEGRRFCSTQGKANILKAVIPRDGHVADAIQ